MKKTKILVLCLSVIAIVLEILPYGAVCIFGNPDGTRIRRTFSYFDIIPYGYANFSPLITAIITSIIFILCLIYMFSNNIDLGKKIKGLSLSATIVSLMPLLLGLDYYSVIGCAISVVLLLIFIILQLKDKKMY